MECTYTRTELYQQVIDALNNKAFDALMEVDINALADVERDHAIWMATRYQYWDVVRHWLPHFDKDAVSLMQVFWRSASYQQDDICMSIVDGMTRTPEHVFLGCCSGNHAKILAHALSKFPIPNNGLINVLITTCANSNAPHALNELLKCLPLEDINKLSSVPMAAMTAASRGHDHVLSLLWPHVSQTRTVANNAVAEALTTTSVKTMEILLPSVSWDMLEAKNHLRTMVLKNHPPMVEFMFNACPPDKRDGITQKIKQSIEDDMLWEDTHWAALVNAHALNNTLHQVVDSVGVSTRAPKM